MLKMADYLPLTPLSRKLGIIKATEIQLSNDSSGVPHAAGTDVCVRACAHVWTSTDMCVVGWGEVEVEGKGRTIKAIKSDGLTLSEE